MGTDKTRRQKLEWFEFKFRETMFNDLPFMNLEMLLALFCKECASTNKTGMEILESFRILGHIKIEGNELKVLKIDKKR